MQASDGTPFYTTIHLPWDGSFISSAWTAEILIARAREERCCLDHYWDQAALLPHLEQLHVARALEAIEPARLPGSGRRCEPKWQFSRSARRRVKEAKKRDNGSSIRSAKTAPQKPLKQAKRVTLQRGVACGECGDSLPRHRKRATFCSDRCRQRAHRRRQTTTSGDADSHLREGV
jgi:hypothetical protein